MGPSELAKKARVILEAVHFASSAEPASLQQLAAREPEVLQFELVLRIILTYLPESTEPDLYTGLLQQLADGRVHEPPPKSLRHVQAGKEVSDDGARHLVRKLHLLPVAQEQDVQAGCNDLLSLFLIHRARRIDAESGSIPEVQQLLEPFVDRNPYLRTWFISNILPLRRLDYDYYNQANDPYTLDSFEKLEGRPAIDSMLSRSAQIHNPEAVNSSRDIRGIVGPWIYGANSRKRRKTHHDRRRSSLTTPDSDMQTKGARPDNSHSGWSDVNEWLADLALRDFSLAAKTIEEWDGPRDVDYDGLDQAEDSDEHTAQRPEYYYAQTGLAAMYINENPSPLSFEQSHHVLLKVARLCGLDRPPAIDDIHERVAEHISREYLDQITNLHLLHNGLLGPANPVTSPTNASLYLASLVLKSCVCMQKLGHPISCRNLLTLASSANWEVHFEALHRTLQKVPVKTRDEDGWANVRRQILWLRDWYYPDVERRQSGQEKAIGIFSQLNRQDVEIELLKAILRASCYDLAVKIYCSSDEGPLPVGTVEKKVLDVAMSFYDGASNGNRTRGGARKTSEIVAAFESHFPHSNGFQEAKALLAATHSMSFYSLTLQHGVPFQPVNIRATKDPLSLIGRILEQNTRGYTKLDDLIEIGQNLAKARPALVSSVADDTRQSFETRNEHPVEDRTFDATRRITSMAIEAALSEHDFDTAYSYIVNRLSPSIARPPQEAAADQIPEPDSNDDVSWRAAYLAGRYSTSSSPPSLRRLEQRLELLSLSLTLAPADDLVEILEVWRTVESEFNDVIAREAAEEDKWNSKGDRGSTALPGGFAPTPAELDRAANQQRPRRQSRVTAAAANEEAPMGLFDVARGAAQAFSKNAFPLKGAAAGATRERPASMTSDDSGEGRVRKRDMVASAVTGGLASGIGWVIGAPPQGKS
ncbi:MAG: hypothetical protein Q9174_004485 [Haloplaca sp. 1 TL-2023]